MAAHRKSDRRRDDLCAVGLRKRGSFCHFTAACRLPGVGADYFRCFSSASVPVFSSCFVDSAGGLKADGPPIAISGFCG